MIKKLIVLLIVLLHLNSCKSPSPEILNSIFLIIQDSRNINDSICKKIGNDAEQFYFTKLEQKKLEEIKLAIEKIISYEINQLKSTHSDDECTYCLNQLNELLLSQNFITTPSTKLIGSLMDSILNISNKINNYKDKLEIGFKEKDLQLIKSLQDSINSNFQLLSNYTGLILFSLSKLQPEEKIEFVNKYIDKVDTYPIIEIIHGISFNDSDYQIVIKNLLNHTRIRHQIKYFQILNQLSFAFTFNNLKEAIFKSM